MPDYNLAGLSPRGFEQLIQAISAKIIGPGIVVFGDGPDGGREAIFEGEIPFPSITDHWSGYCVVQAKFLQRPSGITENTGWLIQELERELAKYSKRKVKVRKPEYFILATNIVLSPVAQRGGKDKISVIFENHKNKLGMIDYRIWDYDQIRAFIDDNEQIRKSYAAWITPGDVLAAAMSFFAPKHNDFDKTIINFIQKEFLSDQYANLEQAGHSVEEATPLAKVFVDLPVSTERKVDPPEETSANLLSGFIGLVNNRGAQKLDARSVTTSRTGKRQDTDSDTPDLNRFVLLGGPGQGKSTVGQFITQIYRANLLRDCPNSHLSRELRLGLADFIAQCDLEKIEFPHGRRFPIRVVLNKFAAALSSNSSSHSNSLLSYLTARIKALTGRDVSIDDFRNWLALYPWILVLDGLDEVPPSSNRDQVLNEIQNFWVDATDCNADILVIATTRPQGYTNDFSQNIYEHWWLTPLSTARALHYAKRLVAARHKADQERQNRIIERLERAAKDGASAKLMSSPLQVTIMAALVDQIGQPPRERWRLFHEYYGVIYRREMERDIPAAVVLRDHKSDISAIHRRVALVLQIESEKRGRTDAKISTGRLGRIVEGRLAEQGHEGDDRKNLMDKILRAATERLVFLVGLEQGEVGFEIRSLQEFMAAEAITDGKDEHVRERLRELSPITHWRNVFLFAAGHCFSEREHLRDIVNTACASLNDPGSDRLLALTFAGSRLAIDILDDGLANRHPIYARLIAREALKLVGAISDDFRIDAQSRLGDVYEPLLKPVFEEALNRYLSSARPPKNLDAWPVLMALIEKEEPWAKEMAERYWPTSIEAIEFIIKKLRYRKPRPWLSDKISRRYFELSPFSLLRRGFLLANFDSHCADDVKRAQEFLGQRRKGGLDIGVNTDPGRLSSGADIKLKVLSLRNDTRLPEILVKYPTKHQGWEFIRLVCEFSRSPSAAGLSNFLHFAAEKWETAAIDHLLGYCPWPMAACILASSSADDLSRLAIAAERGDLGTSTDWAAAEARWTARGITSEDLAHRVSPELPFNSEIRRIGGPPTWVEINIGRTKRAESSSHILMSICLKAESVLAKKIIYSLVTDEMGERIYEFRGYSKKEKRAILSVIYEYSQNHVFADFLLGFDDCRADISENLDLIDSLGRDRSIYLYGAYSIRKGHAEKLNEIANILIECYKKNEKYEGLLPFIQQILLAHGQSIIIEYNDLDSYETPSARKAAFLIYLFNGTWIDISPEELAAKAWSIEKEMPGTAWQSIQMAMAKRENLRKIEDYLVALLQKTPEGDEDIQGIICNSIINILESRNSSLQDRRKWVALGLPNDVFDVAMEKE
jgi:hypothetical protein